MNIVNSMSAVSAVVLSDRICCFDKNTIEIEQLWSIFTYHTVGDEPKAGHHIPVPFAEAVNFFTAQH
jgi:hypothetical protein